MTMVHTERDPLFNRRLGRNVNYRLTASDGTVLKSGVTTGGIDSVRHVTMMLVREGFDPEGRIDEAYLKKDKWEETLRIMAECGITLVADREFPTCLCGCGQKTKGGRFLPHHADRLRSRLAGRGAAAPAR